MILVNVPGINGLEKTKGCEGAPCKIISELSNSEKNLKIVEFNLDNSDIQKTRKIIFNESLNLFKKHKDDNEKIIFLGGDHSISFSILKAFNLIYSLGFLFVLDAHADLMKPLEDPTHEEWLRALLEEGFDSNSILLVGTRKIDDEEKDFLEYKDLDILAVEKIEEFLENEENFKKLNNYESIYISLDIDVLDSNITHATGYPVENGLSLEQLKKFLKKITKLKNFKALDIVEINPLKDEENKTIKLISNIIKKIEE